MNVERYIYELGINVQSIEKIENENSYSGLIYKLSLTSGQQYVLKICLDAEQLTTLVQLVQKQ